jgi:hypothetical protein
MNNDEMPTAAVRSATEKQVKFINDLAGKRQMSPETKERLLSKLPSFDTKVASDTITWLLQQPELPKEKSGWVVPESIPDGRYAIVVKGVYRFFRIVTRGEGERAKRYVQKVLGSPGQFRYERVSAAEWHTAVNGILPDPALHSMLFGREVGACGVCGSPLTDPESIRLGIGPVCRAKMDWWV